MNYLKISFGIFVALAASRFIPHPPNFTPLIALSFYVPVLFGLRFISIVILSFFITDLIIGFHSTLFFTWGSVGIIGLISKYFNKSIIIRLLGALTGAFIFYLISNLGVWLYGYYGNGTISLYATYILAIPFFGYTFLSTLFYSAMIEIFYYFYKSLKKILSI